MSKHFLGEANWIRVNGGAYQIGCTLEEARSFWTDWASIHGSYPFAKDDELPPSLLAAVPSVQIKVSSFSILRDPVEQIGVSFEEAMSFAGEQGYDLPTEAEWEIAERFAVEKMRLPTQGEWCLDFFDFRRALPATLLNPVVSRKKQPIGAPPGRRVIKGRCIEPYHPAMRFHGAAENAPYRYTTFRLVKREAGLIEV